MVWKQAYARQEIPPLTRPGVAFVLDSAAHTNEFHVRGRKQRGGYQAQERYLVKTTHFPRFFADTSLDFEISSQSYLAPYVSKETSFSSSVIVPIV